ncbi:MAG: type III-B CRISPR module RAMP protein Cmr1 [bacterium]
MTMANGERTYQLKALTDLWTGSVTLEEKNGQIKEKTGPDRLIPTGMLGSIRWWFEVLVRGLNGNACDPTDTKCEDRNHCVVCELFGCTGWARKFRFEVLDENGNTKIDQIKQNQTFGLRFTPLRPIRVEEWSLLDATLRLIAKYGAIGGKTVFKPTEELSIANVALSGIDRSLKVNNRTVGSPLKQHDQIIEVGGHEVQNMQELKKQLQDKKVGCQLTIPVKRNTRTEQIDGWVGKKHHQDYGLVEFIEPLGTNTAVAVVNEYATQDKWRKLNHGEFAWASLEHFWCVNGKYLRREDNNKSTFNQVLGRQEAKNQAQQLATRNDEIAGWLAGSQQESKKVFSFKDPARTFGFVKPGLIDFNAVKGRLTNAWGQNGWDFLTGDKVIDQLFAGKEDRS